MSKIAAPQLRDIMSSQPFMAKASLNTSDFIPAGEEVTLKRKTTDCKTTFIFRSVFFGVGLDLQHKLKHQVSIFTNKVQSQKEHRHGVP